MPGQYIKFEVVFTVKYNAITLEVASHREEDNVTYFPEACETDMVINEITDDSAAIGRAMNNWRLQSLGDYGVGIIINSDPIAQLHYL